ncbi:MAG: hypothetical protein RL375_3178 [Pseudomonadota bacterium]|jgi:hypothetical protein
MLRWVVVATLLWLACPASWGRTPPEHLIDYRYCGMPERHTSGVIKRNRQVLSAFRKLHPCPATGASEGACPGWEINHTIPLACGGCDSVTNLDWMPVQAKTCKEWWCRDRWERKVYAADPPQTPESMCKRELPLPMK